MSPSAPRAPRPSQRSGPAGRGATGTGGEATAPDADADAGLGRTHGQLARWRRIAAVVLGLEVVGLFGTAGFAALDLQGRPGMPANYGLAIAGFLMLFAVLLAVAALSLLRGGRFGVGYGLTWQFFQALVAATMLRGGLLPAGAIALVTAIAAAVLLMNVARYTPTPLEQD